MKKKPFIEMNIKGVALDEENQMPIILLKDVNEKAILPLWIGPFEASAIIVELENIHPPRPLTHDLLANMFTLHNFKLEYLEIYSKVETNYYSRINYSRGLKHFTMEVRPSDGIALALRLKRSIFVSEHILQERKKSPSVFEFSESFPSELLYIDTEGKNATYM